MLRRLANRSYVTGAASLPRSGQVVPIPETGSRFQHLSFCVCYSSRTDIDGATLGRPEIVDVGTSQIESFPLACIGVHLELQVMRG